MHGLQTILIKNYSKKYIFFMTQNTQRNTQKHNEERISQASTDRPFVLMKHLFSSILSCKIDAILFFLVYSILY